MKQNKIFIKVITLLVCIFILPKVNAITIPPVDTDQKIYDYANLFTEEEEKELFNKVDKIINKYKVDVVVTTIDSTINPLNTTAEFLEYFYDTAGFGIGDDDNGIILVIDMKNREYNISAIGKTQDIITESRVENILDVMDYHMQNGDYYKAVESFINQTDKFDSHHKYGPPLLWISTLIVALIFAFIMLRKEKKKLKLINDTLEATNYLQNPEIEYQDDDLVNTRTRVIVHPKNNNLGSSRRSSSGSRHRISGRKF